MTLKNRLHIYGPAHHHDFSFIVGDKEALENLRDAIDKALEAGSATGEADSFTADGEGFTVKIYREEEDDFWNKSLLPYTDDSMYYSGNFDNQVGPWDLFKKYKKP